MQLDDLKTLWAAHSATLARSVALNERLLRETMLGKVRSSLVPFRVWRVVEIVLGITALVVLGGVLAQHPSEPRYLIAGGATLLYLAGITASAIALLVRANPPYDHSIVELQRSVQELRILEYRTTKWGLLGGVVVWLPLALLSIEALSGRPLLGSADLAWLIANALFGVGVLVIGLALARRYVERELSPLARRVVDALTGRAVARATHHLTELAQFERD